MEDNKGFRHFSFPGHLTSCQIIIADRQPSYWFTGHYLLYKNTSHGYKVKHVCYETLISKVIFDPVIFNVTALRRAVQILEGILMSWRCFTIPNITLIDPHFFSFSEICSLPGGILRNALTVFSDVGPINAQQENKQEKVVLSSSPKLWICWENLRSWLVDHS